MSINVSVWQDHEIIPCRELSIYISVQMKTGFTRLSPPTTHPSLFGM